MPNDAATREKLRDASTHTSPIFRITITFDDGASDTVNPDDWVALLASADEAERWKAEAMAARELLSYQGSAYRQPSVNRMLDYQQARAAIERKP